MSFCGVDFHILVTRPAGDAWSAMGGVGLLIRQELWLGDEIWESLTYKRRLKSLEDGNGKLRGDENEDKNQIKSNI